MTTETNADAVAAAKEPDYPTDLYSRERVVALSREQQEPAWLADLRLAAWDAFERLPMPHERERAWKYFDPARLRLDGRLSADGMAAGAAPALSIDKQRGALVVQEGGAEPRVEVEDELRAQGVIVAGLAQAARDHGDLVLKHLGSIVAGDESKFAALNSANWSGGVFVYVPRDVEVALPVQVAIVQRTPDTALFPRLLVVLERNAKLTLVEERIGSGDTGGFVAGVTEFVVGEGADLHHYTVQRWGSRVQDVTTQRTLLAKAAKSTTLTAGIGGAVQKWWIDARIEGAGAESNMYGVFFGTGSQHMDVITLQDHIGAHTTSDLLYKSALKDRAIGAYYGLTRVGPDARGTAANQEDRNLLLSPKAKADADPVLEIMTSDVIRCGHGASAGPVDQEQLFYLESRGLPRPQAERLLVHGFLNQVLVQIPLESVRNTVERAIDEKLGA
ncbi:MAG: Fe-S cluster assembly protein SufD [Dehalococcoidia bacterium]